LHLLFFLKESDREKEKGKQKESGLAFGLPASSASTEIFHAGINSPASAVKGAGAKLLPSLGILLLLRIKGVSCGADLTFSGANETPICYFGEKHIHYK